MEIEWRTKIPSIIEWEYSKKVEDYLQAMLEEEKYFKHLQDCLNNNI